MKGDLWLPSSYRLPDGSIVGRLAYSGIDWQLYHRVDAGDVLISTLELSSNWCNSNLLEETLLGSVTFGSKSFRYLGTRETYALLPVEKSKCPDSKSDAQAFASALRRSRDIGGSAISFHDAIYVEQYSRLLPTYTLSPRVQDEMVLGTWLSGGVAISTDSFRRLSKLVGWMPTSDLADVVVEAGLELPNDIDFLCSRQLERNDLVEAKIRADRPEESESQLGPDGNSARDRVFSLPGRAHLENFFNEHVIDIILNTERYQALGIHFPSAIVLHGPPGCGKTYAVERLVEFLDWPSYEINAASVGSPYIHQTSMKISEVFDRAIDAAPSIVIIDEMESFLSDRNTGGASGLHHVEEVAEFLRRIPEATKSSVLIVAMTNMIEMIDPAILRRGRFDHVVEVGMPSRIEVAALLESLLGKLPVSLDVMSEPLLDALTERPLSDAAFAIREASRLAAKSGKSEVDQESLLSALVGLPDMAERKSRRIGFMRDR